MATDVTPLFGGANMRIRTLMEALLDVINERGVGLDIASILGAIKLTEMAFIAQEREKL